MCSKYASNRILLLRRNHAEYIVDLRYGREEPAIPPPGHIENFDAFIDGRPALDVVSTVVSVRNAVPFERDYGLKALIGIPLRSVIIGTIALNVRGQQRLVVVAEFVNGSLLMPVACGSKRPCNFIFEVCRNVDDVKLGRLTPAVAVNERLIRFDFQLGHNSLRMTDRIPALYSRQVCRLRIQEW